MGRARGRSRGRQSQARPDDLDGARLLQHAYDQAGEELLGVWEDFTHEEWHRFIDYLTRFERGLLRGRAERESAPARARNRRSRAGSEDESHA